MIDPTIYDSYPDYFLACQTENEIPADGKTWAAWKYPTSPDTEAPPTSPSMYLTWLVEQLPDLKARAQAGDNDAELLWTAIREQRSQDERIRKIERQMVKQEGDGK